MLPVYYDGESVQAALPVACHTDRLIVRGAPCA